MLLCYPLCKQTAYPGGEMNCPNFGSELIVKTALPVAVGNKIIAVNPVNVNLLKIQNTIIFPSIKLKLLTGFYWKKFPWQYRLSCSGFRVLATVLCE
jgi:hypothetical protein